MRLIFIGILLLFIFLIGFGIQSAFAFDYYKMMGTMFKGSPTYCIMLPNPELEPRYEYLDVITKSALLEWELKLEQKTGVSWNMYNQTYAYDQHKNRKTTDFQQCDVFINFIPEPNKHGILGTASANLDGGYYWLEIQTQITHRELVITIGGNWDDRVSNLVVDADVPLGDIRNTVLHEVGHSLGLEHYYCEPYEPECIDKSVMYGNIATFKGIIKPVTERDINMIVRMYGDDGFYGYWNTVNNICLVTHNGQVC